MRICFSEYAGMCTIIIRARTTPGKIAKRRTRIRL
jgi:hypothetical protein